MKIAIRYYSCGGNTAKLANAQVFAKNIVKGN